MGKRTGSDRKDRRVVRSFLKNRDEGSFRKLYRRHSPALYYLALRLVSGNEGEAKDMVQDTWIRACESLHKFRFRAGLRTWLSGILVNRFRELARSKGKEGVQVNSMEDHPGPVREKPDVKIDLERAIDRLPDGCREVLVLHDLEGFTHKEIGDLLRLAPGTSKSQLFHARRAIRTFFTSGTVQDETGN